METEVDISTSSLAIHSKVAEQSISVSNVDDRQQTGDEDLANQQSSSSSLVKLPFSVSTSLIQSVPAAEQAEELKDLVGLSVYDQAVFEEGVLEQVENAFQRQERERLQKVAERTLKGVVDDIKTTKARLSQIEKALVMLTPKDASSVSKDVKRKIESIQKDKQNKMSQLKSLRAKQKALIRTVNGQRVDGDGDTDVDTEGEELNDETKFELERILGVDKTKESEREKMIRTGQMTPFGTVLGAQIKKAIKLTSELTDFEKYLLDQAQMQETKKKSSPNKMVSGKVKSCPNATKTSSSSRNQGELISVPSTSKDRPLLLPKFAKRPRRCPKEELGSHFDDVDGNKRFKRGPMKFPDPEANVIDLDEFAKTSGSEYVPSSEGASDNEDENALRERIDKKKTKKCDNSKRKPDADGNGAGDSASNSRRKKLVDDGNQDAYLKRIKKWRKDLIVRKHERLMQEEDDNAEEGDQEDDEDGVEEFEGGYRIPLKIWNKLYRYQQTGVRWMWELYCQRCGGIVGDEMGLGKTIQMIGYFAGLRQSEVVSKHGNFKGLGPVIIVTPTTLMHQWVQEFHVWWPPFRVAILHDSGSYSGTKESLIRNINSSNGVLITSYSGVVIHQHLLLKYDWHYVILDEGHKIRNPDARVTLACKQFRTPNRFILSGSPLQNHLKELWSLFDFVFPGKLGTLPVFMQQFAVPITQGGYSNASQVQVQTAYKCAVVLRDTISPYLLRRMKADVKMNLNLPGKNEQVLFCRLSDEQRAFYKDYLASKEIGSILDGRMQVFVGLINLRKICNHPDLYSGGPKVFGNMSDQSQLAAEMHYGYWRRSGKMLVVESILKLWHRQGHRVLLFSQSKQMLDILERFLQQKDYTYLRMDGGTTIGSRQPMIQKFNTDPRIFIFLLTTRVGGLGVNLTGANRVIIYDPDWNPSTDIQARERAWRIGQQRDVTIYRLLTSGTIEEKIYHRQIFKVFMTNRVLKDPKQRRFFKSNDLLELFVLKDDDAPGSESRATETSVIFAGTGSEVKVPEMKSMNRGAVDDGIHAGSCLSVAKLRKMKELAKMLSRKIGQKNSGANGVKLNAELNVASGSNLDAKLDTLSVKESKRHKQKRKRSRKERGADVEGEEIDHLVRKDTFKSTGQEVEASLQSSQHDAYVLQKLFAKTGVHTALKHDTIMDSSDPDYMLVEGEAERVAKEAIKALRASRRECFRAEAGVPTWTGLHGNLSGSSSAAPRLRFGQKKNTKLVAEPEKLSSVQSKGDNIQKPILYNLLTKNKVFSGEVETPATSSSLGKAVGSDLLLAAMINRNDIISATNEGDDNDVESDTMFGEASVQEPRLVESNFRLTTEYDELLVDIRNFIAFQCAIDGEATTAEILDKFRDKVPAKDSAVFKALLSKICDFDRDHCRWRLIGEFR